MSSRSLLARQTKPAARLCLLTAGALELLVGILHFFMPAHAARAPSYARLQPYEMDWNILCILAIGILLIAMGLRSVPAPWG